MLPRALPTSHSLSSSNPFAPLYHQQQTLSYSPSMDPSAVDFRAFYPYTPNEVKHRKRTTNAQLKVLENVFKRDTKPNAALRNELAAQLDMTARGVQVWFQNRRAKEKNKAGKSAATAARDIDEPREPVGSIESILLPQSTFPRDLPELGDSSSQESSPTGTSPPQLHVSIDSSIPSWQSSPLITPDDSRPSGELDMCFIRRGSLPVDAFYCNDDGSAVGPPSVAHLDPFARRRSVDASLHRLAANPYAQLARAKNHALSGSRFPGHVNSPFSLSRSSSTSSDFTNHRPMSHHQGNMHVRRSSADSRAYHLSPHGVTVSPSPSPMSAYHSSTIRSSLPDTRLYAFSTRPITSPLPGPLPSPDYSFGVASSMTSITSPDSERSSPDNSHGLLFRGEDLETEDDGASASYDGYSRFGSITSIASDSSNSAYFSDVNSCVDPSNGSDLGPEVSHQQHRRDSSGHFVGLMSDLNVGGLSHPSQQTTASNERSVTVAPIPVSTNVISLDGDVTRRYPSPSSTVSPGNGTPAERNGTASSSLSRELLHAWQNKPDVNHLSFTSQPLQQHNNPSIPKSEGSFYLAEHRYSPITLPSVPLDISSGEYHFVAQQSTQDHNKFGATSSAAGADSFVGVDVFANHGQHGSQDTGYTIFEDGSGSFM
ncbi:hypothetical protein FB446DRAFT_788257 [Lentinula raphanica]|nr:hypothetical protein FB446DRAFT_788257 [Lentinula raphanica]